MNLAEMTLSQLEARRDELQKLRADALDELHLLVPEIEHRQGAPGTAAALLARLPDEQRARLKEHLDREGAQRIQPPGIESGEAVGAKR